MNREKITRVLIHRIGSIGDTVVALPSFHLVREAFPRAHVTLLTNYSYGEFIPTLATILDGSGLVDEYMEYPRHLRDPRQILALRRRIVERRFDYLVHLSQPQGNRIASVRVALFFLGCGLVRQVGVPYRRRDLSPVPLSGTDRYRPEAERLVGCLRRLGRPDLREQRWWDLHLSDAERREAEAWVSGLSDRALVLAVNVGSKVDVKDWTEANWRALIRRLAARYPGQGLVALGSPSDLERSQRVLSEWQGPTLNLCGKIPLRVSAGVLERCNLFIGHDSGPMHLAASVGTPCVAIFSGQSLPGVWYPRGEKSRVLSHPTPCQGCYLDVCHEHQKKCILSIGVDRVFEAVVDLLPGLEPGVRREGGRGAVAPSINAMREPATVLAREENDVQRA